MINKHYFQEFDTPCTPQEIHTALYTRVQPHHIIGAVLQQELILYCGKLIATQPDLFDGILVLRMSLFVRAMAMFQNYISPNSNSPLENLPPSKILTLLEQMLSMTVMGSKKSSKQTPHRLTTSQISSINGCLIRVPENFYPSIYNILKRCPGGLTFGKKHLSQKSTLKMMDAYELNFFHTVEAFLVPYVQSGLRFLVIRVLVILSTVLTRNPELTYRNELVVDSLVTESLNLYLRQHNLGPVTQITEDTDLQGMLGLEPATLDSFIARAIVNMLLGAEIANKGTECKLQ